MAIYRSQVAVFVCPFVPDGHSVILEIFHIGVSGDEPEKLIDDGFQMDFLRGQKRKSFTEIVTHLISEYTLSTCAGTVGLHCSVLAYMS